MDPYDIGSFREDGILVKLVYERVEGWWEEEWRSLVRWRSSLRTSVVVGLAELVETGTSGRLGIVLDHWRRCEESVSMRGAAGEGAAS